MNPFVSTVWRNSRVAIVTMREKRNPLDLFVELKRYLALVVVRDRRVL